VIRYFKFINVNKVLRGNILFCSKDGVINMKKFIYLILLLHSAYNFSFAQSSNEWRPENRTGVSAEAGLLKKWPAGGPALMWSNLELAKGNSSPSFGNNSIYITGNKGDDDILFALDMKGKILWQRVVGRAWKESYPESRPTPTIDGKKVYVTSGAGDIACIDAIAGSVIWSVKAGDLYKGSFGPWGIAESLLIDGNKLYFTPGGNETTMVALDKTTGKLIWKSESLKDRSAYVSPIIINYSGKKYIINVSASYIFSVDPATGKIVWRIKHLDIKSDKAIANWNDAPAIKCVTPIYNDGKIYVTGGYDHGGFMIKLSDAGNKADVIWTDELLDVHHGGVVLLNGYIYGSNWINNSNGDWVCIDWNTGSKKWVEHWNCKGSIISAEGMLYIYDERKGNVGLLKVNPEKFDLVSTFQVTHGSAGPFWAHPVIHKGVLYLRHTNALMAYDIKSK